jgi:predicted  nucleic acid-binding Zn-ribbon protein
MDENKYDRSISLMCPTCGHKDFEHDETDESPVRCAGCDRVLTRDELIRENGELIDSAVDELKTEVVKDIQKELRDSLRKAFGNSKHITFK